MEIGVDSFVWKSTDGSAKSQAKAEELIAQFLDRVAFADQSGLDVFGIGEHYRKDFLDSAPIVLLSAAAARTKRIKLMSAVTVLSAADPVRVFQNFATLDLVSNGRAEIVAGRGSFVEAYPLFGLSLEDYDELFAEKLDLLLQIRNKETLTWKGKFRAPLHEQSVYPRPVQDKLPIWLGVGGTPQSFVRAGVLGLPLMIAIIGGETHRFRPLVDLYKEAWIKSGHPEKDMKVGLHSFGYVAETTQKAKDEFFPGYAESMSRIGKERGWPPVSRAQFEAQCGPTGAYIIGDAEEVAEKIHRHSQALGGISRLTFQMDSAGLSHEQLMRSIELLGSKVKPKINTF